MAGGRSVCASLPTSEHPLRDPDTMGERGDREELGEGLGPFEPELTDPVAHALEHSRCPALPSLCLAVHGVEWVKVAGVASTEVPAPATAESAPPAMPGKRVPTGDPEGRHEHTVRPLVGG